MWLRRQLDEDWVAGSDFTTDQDDGHDTCLADEGSLFVVRQHCRHQPRLKLVQLQAGVAQAHDFYDGGSAQVQTRVGRQSQQIHPAGGDILAHLPSQHGKTGDTQLIVELSLYEVDLAQIRLGRVAGHPGAVLDPLAGVSVALNP